MEKMNLLICDDEWMIRESIVQTALSMEEFNVFTAVTGRTALELLEEEEIDGVVLDMQMPEMDGITFLQHMKSRKKDCAVIVLLSLIHISFQLAHHRGRRENIYLFLECKALHSLDFAHNKIPRFRFTYYVPGDFVLFTFEGGAWFPIAPPSLMYG